MNRNVILNGDIIPEGKASIGISDLAILRGYGIFDSFKTVNGHPIWLDDHLERFYHSASQMNLPVKYDSEELKQLLSTLMEKNDMPDSVVRMTLTGGYSPDGYNPGIPNLIVTQQPFSYDQSFFEKGTSLITFSHQRQLPGVKTIDYLQAVMLQPMLREKGAGDVLYHFNSEVLECPRSNFFIVTADNDIRTPMRNILPGINRKKVLDMHDLNVRETIITLDDLQTIKEAFITSTTKTVLPVLQIDGRQIGDGKPGEVTRSIWKRLLISQLTN